MIINLRHLGILLHPILPIIKLQSQSFAGNTKNRPLIVITRVFSRKVSSLQVTEDVTFSKKISERFDAGILGDTPNVKIDYYRQPSREITRDPRDFRSVVKVTKDFKPALLIASDSEWIRGEPARHVFIDQISSKQVRTDLNLYALLEEQFQLSENDIINITLESGSAKETLCASVLFSSGYKAWECVRTFNRQPSKDSNWIMTIDPSGKEFERLKMTKLANVREESKQFTGDRDDRHDLYERRDDKRNTSLRPSSKCNPFVPCLKIPFSCESSLPFRLDENVLLFIFPESRFPSISGVEEGGSSWHIHFGREIDVVEADRMLQSDVFVWKSFRFYFEKWKLEKGGQQWTIPDYYNQSQSKPHTNVMLEDTSEIVKMTEFVHVNEGDFFKLPKFIKKRPREATVDNVDNSKDDNSIMNDFDVNDDNRNDAEIKMKVKRKPIKKVPFVPPSIQSPMDITIENIVAKTPETEPANTSHAMEIVEIVEKEECPLLITGSARTEGFFKLSREEKQRVRFKGFLEAFSTFSGPSNAVITNLSADTGSSGRSSRVQNRRPLLQTTNQVTLDLFKVSPLQSTQKLVALRNSSIHSFGLVMMESAEPGDLIIEYVGELVRASVANIREWKYEREYKGDGIASSYLFRLDGIMVIDASQQGNLARFINHSCDPNCVAKTITLNGSKRIVMYAKKSLRAGEEITYDYKFPTEKDPKKKVKCLCGSSSCRKYLN